mmetsp:Transcript_7564/g.19708  ORF Transcript_7564/g.19708 Transcript_7564/m.19708 type:complete len:281 (-) Transcript_7564:409-1251(-)
MIPEHHDRYRSRDREEEKAKFNSSAGAGELASGEDGDALGGRDAQGVGRGVVDVPDIDVGGDEAEELAVGLGRERERLVWRLVGEPDEGTGVEGKAAGEEGAEVVEVAVESPGGVVGGSAVEDAAGVVDGTGHEETAVKVARAVGALEEDAAAPGEGDGSKGGGVVGGEGGAGRQAEGRRFAVEPRPSLAAAGVDVRLVDREVPDLVPVAPGDGTRRQERDVAPELLGDRVGPAQDDGHHVASEPPRRWKPHPAHGGGEDAADLDVPLGFELGDPHRDLP